ncbi:MAG TPA: hypothetical protein PLI89_10685 [Chitinophagales bacterium]|nr:hypothetical protein [Chitinophagales bacterium]
MLIDPGTESGHISISIAGKERVFWKNNNSWRSGILDYKAPNY